MRILRGPECAPTISYSTLTNLRSKNAQLPKVLRPGTSRHTANTWARNYGRLTIFRLKNERKKNGEEMMFDGIRFYFLSALSTQTFFFLWASLCELSLASSCFLSLEQPCRGLWCGQLMWCICTPQENFQECHDHHSNVHHHGSDLSKYWPAR